MNQPRRPGFPARIASLSPSTAVGPRVASVARPAAPLAATGWGMDSAAVRMRMVQRLAADGIQSPAVLQAMGQVPRHQFVDSALVAQAYEDTSLPIGLQQTISKPSVVARMIELLLGAACVQQQNGLGRVLEVGTGCGYQAAVLAQVAREVYSIERLRGLHEKARANLRPLRLANVHLLFGDGMLGYAQGGPYAAIIAAAGGESLPPAWPEQLALGGRLVAPMVTERGQQMLLVVDKNADGSCTQTLLEAVHFVPLKSGVA